LSALAGGGASGAGFEAASNLASAARKRIKARGVGKFVVLYGAPDGRCHRGELVVGEINRRHGLAGPSR
jgi:hypothetical protein